MPRPLRQHGIVQLEEIFLSGRTNKTVLLSLQNELVNRHVPRAVSLLGRVRTALRSAQQEPAVEDRPQLVGALPPEGTGDKQPDLWGAVPTVATFDTEIPPVVEQSKVDVAEAYRILKATRSSTWEAIEQIRRTLVQQAHPDNIAALSKEQQARIKANAKQVNAAYAVLLSSRMTGAVE